MTVIINSATGAVLSDSPTQSELEALALLGALDAEGDVLWGAARAMFMLKGTGHATADKQPPVRAGAAAIQVVVGT